MKSVNNLFACKHSCIFIFSICSILMALNQGELIGNNFYSYSCKEFMELDVKQVLCHLYWNEHRDYV